MAAIDGSTDAGSETLTLKQLKDQLAEAEGKVYRWFRFRVRRGIGMLYCLFSFLPVFGTLLYVISGSTPVAILGGTVAGVGSSIVFRTAGLRGVGKMSSTIGMMKGRSSPGSLNRRATSLLGLLLLPWVAYGAAVSFGQASVAAAFAVLWLAEFAFYRALTAGRAIDPIIEPGAADWLAAVSFPLGAVLSTFPGLPDPLHYYGFLLVSPLLLLAGAKSLYDAPKELVVDNGTNR